MTNRSTARAYVEQAGVILEEAKSLRDRSTRVGFQGTSEGRYPGWC